MRIVKLSDLSEDEKKKVLEEQQARIEENNRARQQLQQNANNQFNDLINKEGSYNTNKHTYKVSDMKNNSSKDYLNTFKKSNNITLWDYITGNFNNNISTWNQVQNIAKNNLNESNNINNTRNMINNIKQTPNNNTFGNYVFGNVADIQRDTKGMLLENNNIQNKNKTIIQEVLEKADENSEENKNPMLFSEQDKKIVPIKINNESNPQEKNDNILQDARDVTELTGLGILSGSKGVLNYIESANENNFSNYKNLRKQQFLTSQNTSEDEKAIAKTQNNLLLQKNGINIENKVETNLVKKAIRDSINKDEEEIAKIQSRISNKGMQKLGELAPSMGQMLPGTIASAVNPILGTAYFTTSSGGSYINDALDRGMNEEQAFKYGTIMGALEGASESFITGQQVNKITKAFNGKQISKKVLDSYGFNMFENAVQEAVMEPAQELTATVTGGTDKANWSNMISRMAESGFNGALMGAITNGVTYGLEKSVNIYNKIKNGKNVTANEYKEALQENIEKFGKENVEESMKKGAIETYQELNDIVNIQKNNQVAENNNQQTPIVQNTQVNDNQNLSDFTQLEQETQTNTQKYQYEKSDNVKIDNLRQDANRYFNNSEQAHNYINMLEQIVQDKDVDIRFDNTLVDENGNIANGKYKDGVITINPNSTRTGEFIAIHELTHAIGTKEMMSIVENYRKSNAEFNTVVQDLLKNYNQTEITEEALADVSAQLFGNQEFINNLSQTNPSIFKKIYNEIKYLWHQFRGYKNQNQFIEDLQYKWEQAYKSNNELNRTINYSIQTDNNGNRYVRVDTDQDIFDGINEKDYNKIAKMYMQDYLEGKTKLAENDTVKIGNKGISKYTNPKQQTRYMNEKMQLSTELKNVLEVAEKVNSSLPTKDTSKFPNWEYYKVDFEIGGKNFEGLINIGIDKKGNKHFYEINKIHITSNSHVSTSKSSNTDSINNSILPTQENVNSDTQKYSMQESENNSGSFNLKEKQLEIIQKNNPMQDDYHTGIRNIEDIKTFEETLQDSDWADYDEFNSDYTKSMAEDAIKTGKITVYSSYPIKQGTFISPSYMEAESYSGDGKVYSKEVNLNDVAWIDPTQGQYAKVENNKYSKNNESWQEYLDNNFKVEGTRTNLQDINLPTKENIQKSNQTLNLPTKGTIQNIPLSKKAQTGRNLKVLKESIGIKNDIITQKVIPLSENKQSEKVAQILSESPTKVKESDRKWAIFKAGILDKGIVFEELSHKTKNRELQGKWDYTLSATARGQNAIGNARYELDSKTKKQKQICKSLEDIRTEVGEDVAEFSNYMYHQLNVDRMTLEERFDGDTGINYERRTPVVNKPVFGDKVTAEMSKAEVVRIEKVHPEFKEYAQDVYDFLNANKAELVNNGVISQTSADRMADMYPHYVPIGRVNTKGNAINVPLDTGRTGINSPIKSAKGGSSDILPLFDTIAQRTLQTYRASARNSFGVELKNTLNTVINTEQTSVDNVIDTMGKSIEEQDLLKEGKNGNNPTFTVFENGEKVTYEITKDMYDALKPVSESSILGKTYLPLNKVSNFRRGVLTEYNPLFMITNAVKDMQDVLINSQHSVKTYSKFPEAYAQIVKKGYWYQEYVQNGGEQNSYFNANDNIFESDIKKSKVKGVLNIPLNAISNINNVIELAPRLSEYIASREAGRSIETSMLDASRVTTNFKAGGDITKALNRNGATFLNASVQGMMQQARNIAEANTKGLKGYAVLATKYAVAGLPALILNNLIWKDDDDYDELQDYVKDNYYCIAKFGDGKFIRIPKGRMLSTIQSIVTNASEYITKDKELNIDNFASDFWEDINSIMDNVAPNNPLDNNVISPIIQAITNKSWYGEDIVPSRLQDKPEAEQYDETTDSLSKWLGEKLNISPYKINYLLDQYGGGISDVALPMMTKQAENNPIEDKFTTDSVMKSKYAGNFFDTVDELKVNANGSKATAEDKIKYKYMSSLQGDLSELYVKKREIQNSDDSDKDKRVKLKEVQKQINKIARDGLASLDNLEITENTAKIGNKQYYNVTSLKSGEKEWKELSEEDAEKTKGISLKTYADYKEKIAQTTINQRKNGTISDDGQLKDKDKIQILLSSNYSDKEKSSLYKSNINSKDTLYNSLLSKDNINVNEYLNYKIQEFESDKKDDGTVDGKSVSGSKKKKVYDYVNNMNVSRNHKLAIIGSQYKLNSSEQKELYEYINNISGQTIDEKLEIFKEYSTNFTIYKNKTISFK